MRCQDTGITGSMEETGWKWPVWREETENCSLRELALGSGLWDQGAAASGVGTRSWREGAEPGHPGGSSGSGRPLLSAEEHSVPPGAGK